MTVGEVIARTLIEQRVGTVFGIPGALNAHLYEGLRRHQGDLRHVLVRHELGGAWMADGYARAGGDVGVLLTVPGPGATHAASGIAGAYTDCSRVLLISAQSESRWRGELRRDLFHGLDQQRLFAPITKWQAAVHSAEAIAPALEEAFGHLRSGRPGPVHVEIPADVLGHEAPGEIPGYVTAIRPEAPVAQVRQAADALASARHPLILAGDGVVHSDAVEAVTALAERLRAPVVTTVLGKGAVPEDHTWSLGDLTSKAGSQAYLVADLVLAAGVRFVQVDTRWPWWRPPARLIHVEADPREIGRVYTPEVALCADPRAVLEQLISGLGERDTGPDEWAARMPGLWDAAAAQERHPLLQALRRALPREGLAAFDVCYPGFRSRADWTCLAPRGYYYPGVYVSMGFGLPAGIGAKLARPEAPVLVVAGDGGFQMTMPELATAAQHGVPVVIVVVNDHGLELIRRVQDRDFGGRRFAVELENPDFCALADAYGIEAYRVNDPGALEKAADQAFSRERLTLIEYRTDE